MFKKCSVLAVLCFVFIGLRGQKTAAYLDKDAAYKQGLELFDKKQFVAAQKSFTDYLESKHSSSLLAIDAEYYAASCAIELFHKDGEWRMREFINRHPESNKVNGAYFYLGKSSFRRKKHEETIKNLEKVDIYKLTKDDLAELYFKRGYSYLENGNQEKAKADFYEIKDVDNKYAHPANYYYSHIAYKEKKYDLALQGFTRLLNNETFGPVVPYYITQIYFVQGKYQDVVKDAPNLLNDSNNVQKANEIYRMVGESYYNLKDYKNAIEYLKKTSGLGRAGNYALGYCYYKLNDCPNAITNFERVTDEKDSLSQNAWYHLGDCFIRINEKPKARNAFYSAYTINFDKKITEDALFSYAKLCYELDFSPFNEAVKAFSKYLKEYPSSQRKDEVYRYLINVYSTTKSYDQAIASIESLESIDPIIKTTYAKLIYFRGIEFFNNTDYDNASKYFKKAISLNSDKTINALSTYWLGEISYQRKDYSTAIETWQNFQLLPGTIQLPEYNKVHYNMGYSYFQRKEKDDYTNANIAFRKYLLSQSDDVMRVSDANVRAADCYFMKKDYAQASELYETAIALNKVDVDYSYFQKALCNGLIKNHKEKINDLKTIESKFPNSNYLSAALFEIADTYNKDLNDPDNAILYYDKVLTKYPKSSFANQSLSGMGLVFYNQKKDDKAFWYFDQIVKKDPKSDESREVLPMIKKIFQTKGDIEGMEKYFASIGNPLSVNELEKDLYTSIQDAYYNEKNCDLAIPKLENYISKFPDGKYINEVQYSYGECTYSKNMLDKALAAYQFIIGKSRSIYSEVAYSKAAYILYKDKKYTEALPLFLQMQEVSETPSNKLAAKLGAMRSAFYLNQYETALTESNKVLSTEKLSPQQTSEAKYIKAKSLFETQRYDDALADFKGIGKTSKNLTGAEALYHVALIYFIKKEYKETEKAVNALISYEYSNDDWNTKGMLLIADVYIEKGDDKDAEVILQTIIEGKPKQEFIDEANKRLEQIKQRRESKQNTEQKQQDLNIEFKTTTGDKNLFENQNSGEQQNTTKPEEPK
jgi:tetratricopeptide (TPR) repeat protein